MANGDRRPENPFGFKRITDYTADELDLAVQFAVDRCKAVDLDFFSVLRGVDAYMEKRRRKRTGAEEPTAS